MLYRGPDELVKRAAALVRGARAAGEPILVMLASDTIESVRSALDGAAEHALFVDVGELGRNPSRIIPAWASFLQEHAASGIPVRAIGETIWAGRTVDEVVEAQRCERLLDLAFAAADAWIVCPYDTSALPADVIDEARRAHPLLSTGAIARPGGGASHSDGFGSGAPLPTVPRRARSIDFDRRSLATVRRWVEASARAGGLNPQRSSDLVLAANEVAANCIRHGGAGGRVMCWSQDGRLNVEVRGAGRIDNPLAGMQRPDPGREGGSGLWLANQLCDLVQVRVVTDGSAIRLQMILA